MLQFTFLGTSAGIPTKKRNVTALAIECLNPYAANSAQQSGSKKPWILIDCGEATQHQLLHTKLSVRHLAAICITHVHGDHCYGLPGLLASMAMSGRTAPLTLIAPKAILTLIQAVQSTTDLYLPYDIDFVAIEDKVCADQSVANPVVLQLSAAHKLEIEIVKLSHRVASYGFVITQVVQSLKLNTHKLKQQGIAATAAWGQLQAGQDVMLEDGRKLVSVEYTYRESQQLKVVVGGDNDTPELLQQAVQGANVLIHEATYTQSVRDKIMSRPDGFDPMHTTAKCIAQFAQAMQLPALILTHFSARYHSYDDPESKAPNMADIRLEVGQYYQGKLWLARDFMRFLVDSDGVRQLPT